MEGKLRNSDVIDWFLKRFILVVIVVIVVVVEVEAEVVVIFVVVVGGEGFGVNGFEIWVLEGIEESVVKEFML